VIPSRVSGVNRESQVFTIENAPSSAADLLLLLKN